MRGRSNFSYWFSEALHSIKNNKRSSIASVIAITVCLVLVGTMCVISNILLRSIEEEAKKSEYIAFVDENLSDEQAYALQNQLLEIGNVASVEFISRDTAKKDFASFLDSDALDELPSSIFRHRYTIEMIDSGLAEVTVTKIRNIDGIAKVNGETEVSEGLTRIHNGIQMISTFTAFLLLTISFVIISNTISSSMQYRVNEIRIMRLCGVKESHIRIPSLFESMILGLVSAFFAFWLQGILYYGFYSVMAENNLVSLLNIPIFSYYAVELILFNLLTTLLLSLGAGILSSSGSGKRKAGQFT